MAQTELALPPRLPLRWGPNGPATTKYDYDEESDCLFVWFVPSPRPAYNDPIDDYMSFRVDMTTGEVVGIEIERFVAKAIEQDPMLLAVARFVGVQSKRIQALIKQQDDAMPAEERGQLIGIAFKKITAQYM